MARLEVSPGGCIRRWASGLDKNRANFEGVD